MLASAHCMLCYSSAANLCTPALLRAKVQLCVCAAADRGLLRTESMPARELTSPRGRTGRSRTAADLLKPGPAGVAKTLGSPRPIMRSASVRRMNPSLPFSKFLAVVIIIDHLHLDSDWHFEFMIC